MKKRVIPIAVSVLLIVLSLGRIAVNIYDILATSEGITPERIITDILACLVSAFALIYCFTGYKKKAALYFKIFCIAAAVSQMMVIYVLAPYVSSSVNVQIAFFLVIISFGAWSIVAIVKDLGKKTTFWISGIILDTSIIITLLNIPGGLFNVLKSCLYTALCVIFFIMVIAKYREKETRGTE